MADRISEILCFGMTCSSRVSPVSRVSHTRHIVPSRRTTRSRCDHRLFSNRLPPGTACGQAFRTIHSRTCWSSVSLSCHCLMGLAASRLTAPTRTSAGLHSKGSPPEAICQRDSGITETIAPVSSLVPLSLPFTHGVSPACSPAMGNIRRFPGSPPCVLVGSRWVRRLSWGQSRRRWSKPPQLKQPSLLLGGRTAVGSCFSSFREIFLTSRIKSSMDWVASVFSGFGLPVCVCLLWWKSSSDRMTLLTSLRASIRVVGSCSRIARYASFEVIPPAKRATRSRSDTPALRPTSATSWAYCSMV
ncbi:hypothetical protein T09_12385 [Trichinella sp. T9]|nr:hypothetical protein T09_12385 [Trichinella sp. T9]